jgi:hypothetical protein
MTVEPAAPPRLKAPASATAALGATFDEAMALTKDLRMRHYLLRAHGGVRRNAVMELVLQAETWQVVGERTSDGAPTLRSAPHRGELFTRVWRVRLYGTGLRVLLAG